MKIEFTLVNDLRPYPNNARTHSKKQIRQIANSITKFGFCNPVLIDDEKQIVAGHGRLEAAKLLGIDAVPTCRLSHLSEADKRAYILADNKLAEKAGWDKELLAIELQGLIDLDVEIELTGSKCQKSTSSWRMLARRAGHQAGRKMMCRNIHPARSSARPETCGCWGTTVCSAQMPAIRPPTRACSKAPRRNSYSRTRHTMS